MPLDELLRATGLQKFCLEISQNSIFSDQVQPEEKLKLKGAMPLHSIGGVPGKLEKLQKTN